MSITVGLQMLVVRTDNAEYRGQLLVENPKMNLEYLTAGSREVSEVCSRR
ncbi:MAG: hypothetical protein ACLR6I_00700 [Waltera sp.]